MLTKPEIYRIVNDFIGVHDGYLEDFSYRTHYEFYPYYCDLDIDVADYEPGTTREKFIRILEDAGPRDQAKILKGLLLKFPPPVDSQEPAKRASMRATFDQIIDRLEAGALVETPELEFSTVTVEQALQDAEVLIETRGPTNAVDRVHTAFHGYLKALCDEASIDVKDGADITTLFKMIRQKHPAVADFESRHIVQVYRGLAKVVAALNPIRNNESLAHPNELLIDETEAALMINSVRTLLRFLDQKVGEWRKRGV